jgi:hypothetical protein
LLCKIEVWNFKVTTILGQACDAQVDEGQDGEEASGFKVSLLTGGAKA